MRDYENSSKIEHMRKVVISAIDLFESLYGPINYEDYPMGYYVAHHTDGVI